MAIDAKNGTGTLFSAVEERNLVDHISYMADIGYGYSKSSIQYMAKDYAESLSKEVKASEAMSNCWFYGFMGRWPELKIVKPQKLSIARAKSASHDALVKYYRELGTILTSNNLKNKPERIYNIDETGVSTEHNPPKVICNKDTKPQSVTSPRGSTVTIIAAGNAIGNSVPPYYVFPGQRWNDELLSGSPSGASGEMSKSGWSSSSVFYNYLTKHFVKYVNISDQPATEPTLILYDGHRSHISLTLTEWARRHNVILFVLPPHTSHLTQPLDVGVFGPFKTMYNTVCQNYMKSNPGLTITKYQIAELTCKPYLKSLTAENLTAAFRKTGIHPFNSSVLTDSQVAPSTIYASQDKEQSNHEEASTEKDQETSAEKDQDPSAQGDQQPVSEAKETAISDKAIPTSELFFKNRTITAAVKNRSARKFVPPFLAGNLMKKSISETLAQQSAKKKSKTPVSKDKPSNNKQTKSVAKKSVESVKRTEKIKLQKSSACVKDTPVPSTSGINRNGNAINLMSSDESSDYASDGDDEKCCVCDSWQPEAIRGCQSIIFVKWAKCDFCSHWTHLQFCTEVRVIRRGSEFRCPHCLTK
ncbi:MAG: hypothetical protein AB2693_08525 [Candidatus Thiodiazotropha sp.]